MAFKSSTISGSNFIATEDDVIDFYRRLNSIEEIRQSLNVKEIVIEIKGINFMPDFLTSCCPKRMEKQFVSKIKLINCTTKPDSY